MKFESHKSMPLEEMPRVTRQEFCDRMDEILDRVSTEDIAYVITHESGQEYVLCPAVWFRMNRDDDFDVIIACAVRYAMGRHTYMPSLVESFVRRWMDVIGTNALKTIARDIDEELRMFPDMEGSAMWAKLRDDLRKKVETEAGDHA